MIGSPLASPWDWEDRQPVLYAVAGAVLAWFAVRALEWAWWRPRRLERALRSQGLRGTAYRSLAGDAPLLERLNKEARSQSLPLGCHDVVPRAMPLFHHAMKEHGACSCRLCLLSFSLTGPWLLAALVYLWHMVKNTCSRKDSL